MNLLCSIGGHEFTLSDEDIASYAKFAAPVWNVCFPHQQQWRLSFRNDRFLHKRRCDGTEKTIISMYANDAPYKVYEREYWMSDAWDPLEFGQPYDFSRPFFEQFAEIQKRVPRVALVNIGSTNSEYCNSCVYNKNSYLIVGGDRNEDCLYGILPMESVDCVDCDWTIKCELCYFSAFLENCYGCQFAFNSKSCTDCYFIEDCIGSKDCIMSFNLRNRQYVIENKQYTKEEYFRRKAELMNGSYTTQQQLWEEFKKKRQERIVKYARILQSENSTGDLLSHTKNCTECYEVFGGEDCRRVFMGLNIKDCYNSEYVGESSELVFNNISTDTAYNVRYSYMTVNSDNVTYCDLTPTGSHYLFGCVGLKNKSYCILNKQYTKSEWEELVPRIIEHMKSTGEWGQFLPKSLSTFPYNNSVASVYYPLKKEEALAQGWRWEDDASREERATSTAIPNNIHDIDNSILEQTLICEASNKPYRIIEQELNFYKKMNIPLPRREWRQRALDRLALTNPKKLWQRQCTKCNTELQSPYAPERPEQIYCEKCYLGCLS
ncbi:hypothetical protein COV82_00470 [Candidatus Peregrinibacteria bacterium CG11_big_fil_rev_8_21_14_0_20_46_8]|nr:MAG: hypothetical protein COV82_00470 [Candidatus Peregrinibacteria bacterium CG11_big_fil_rev_8_21_14_0_20_46_8]